MQNLLLHHCSQRIAPNTLEFVMGLFKELGCKQSYWKDGERWAMVEQDNKDVIIQFIETDQKPQETGIKKNSHIAFLSDNPQEIIENIGIWVEKQGKKFASDKWTEKELYFDCPDVFIDFVIEIMSPLVIEEANK